MFTRLPTAWAGAVDRVGFGLVQFERIELDLIRYTSAALKQAPRRELIVPKLLPFFRHGQFAPFSGAFRIRTP